MSILYTEAQNPECVLISTKIPFALSCAYSGEAIIIIITIRYYH